MKRSAKKSRRRVDTMATYEPEQVKLDINYDLVYKDGLENEHFLELRQYLAKKKKNKMNEE